MNRRIAAKKSNNRRVRTAVAQTFTNGDVVQRINPNHRNGSAVVVGRRGTRIEVQTSPGKTELWYATSAELA